MLHERGTQYYAPAFVTGSALCSHVLIMLFQFYLFPLTLASLCLRLWQLASHGVDAQCFCRSDMRVYFRFDFPFS